MHELHHLQIQATIQGIKKDIHQIKEDHKIDLDSKLPVTIMNQILKRLIKERAVNDLEKRVGNIEVALEKMAL